MKPAVKSLNRKIVTSKAKSADSTNQSFNGSTILIADRQRVKKINTRVLKKFVAEIFLELKISEVELGINIVSAREMALVNETFLQHEGSTDVITFDHVEKKSKRHARSLTPPKIHGELFICVDDAIAQAQEFKTNWQSEIVRYCVHGILHLLGYDDLKPDLRREMKRAENRLVQTLAKKFSFAQLSRTAKLRA